MPNASIVRLTDRGVVNVAGPDSEKLLQGLFTNEIEGLAEGSARFAGLLSPQGKILFDFFVVRVPDGYLLDVAAEKAPDLVKRLAMYKLRADVTITDVTLEYSVHALWGNSADQLAACAGGILFADPRASDLGFRLLTQDAVPALSISQLAHLDYDALRVRLGVPEGGKDYAFGDAYPHEADYDLFNGVSFTKGCYVGQEVVARMQNKTVVRKRVVRISAASPLVSGADVLVSDVVIGRVGTVDGTRALALIRLDRVLDAEEKNLSLTSHGTTITIESDALDRYRRSARSSATLQS
ncbi:folate-binding protein [Hyphomicrobium methylovorum]|uniref:CAF17-like 4Fe-4S cluster assembly/insertion protein YgfZ n=1 Tax=Hyphomicrobium methylovorum TaxID=84 RepID=UPI0015E65A30|nr:folate-binding protein YgfZ [Hyphomicrobium methylovorum]MBA2127281.1 folate-binding protein [Hyphomicrobium methylovorum]